MSKKKILITLISIILGGIFIDLLSKLLVKGLMDVGQSVTVIPGVLNLTYVQNRGAAFGMLSNNRWVFMVISTIAIIGISVYLFRFCKERMLMRVGLALIISGGIGNMVDRTAYGYVIDMIDFHVIWKWVFNVADSCVCVGAGIVILSLILDIIKETKSKKKKDENKK